MKIVAILLFVSSVAFAQESERPWAKGISQDEQTRATDLLHEGNNYVGQMFFSNAADKYKEALKHWDHPAIRYNLALALFALGDHVGVHENIVAALKYGEEPLGHDKFVAAQDYLQKSEAQLTHLFVSCSLAGAVVTMDGNTIFTGPGKWDGWVKPGRHAINATHTGYVTAADNRELPQGKEVKMDLQLYRADEATYYVRKFPVWKAWTVVGSGALLLAVGGVTHALAANSFSSYDKAISACDLSMNHQCKPSADVSNKQKTGQTEQAVAFVGYGLGVATLAVGAYLLYVDRPIAYSREAPKSGAVSIVPAVGPREANVSLFVRF